MLLQRPSNHANCQLLTANYKGPVFASIPCAGSGPPGPYGPHGPDEPLVQHGPPGPEGPHGPHGPLFWYYIVPGFAFGCQNYSDLSRRKDASPRPSLVLSFRLADVKLSVELGFTSSYKGNTDKGAKVTGVHFNITYTTWECELLALVCDECLILAAIESSPRCALIANQHKY